MMSNFRLKPILVSVILSVSSFATTSSQANMNNVMGNIFDGYATAGGPTAYKSALGTNMSGGYVKFRTQSKSLGKIVDFKPPSFKGGCGGFDLFLGSFYYISGDRLIEYLEQVAQDASSIALYAFLTSLNQNCSVCEKVTKGLETATRDLNSFNRNSCEVAQDINASLKKNGPTMDIFKAFKNEYEKSGDGGLGQVAAGENSGLDKKDIEKKIYGNMLVYALVNHETIAGAFGVVSDKDKKALYEQMLSLFGSVVVTAPVSKNGKVDKPDIKWFGPLTSFKMFLDGNDSGDDMYSCDTIPSKTSESASKPIIGCLNPTPKKVDSSTKIKGLRTIIDDMFSGSDGILEKLKIRDSDPQYTPEQKAMISALSQFSTVMEHLVNLRKNPNVMTSFYNHYSDQIATAIAVEIFSRVYDEVYKSLSEIKKAPGSDPMIERIKSRYEVLYNEATIEMSKFNGDNMDSNYRNYEFELKPK